MNNGSSIWRIVKNAHFEIVDAIQQLVEKGDNYIATTKEDMNSFNISKVYVMDKNDKLFHFTYTLEQLTNYLKLYEDRLVWLDKNSNKIP